MEKQQDNRREAPESRGAGIIAGRNAVSEALRAGRTIDSLYVQRGERSGALQALIRKAKDAGAAIKEADPRKLDALSQGGNHQGVAAVVAAHAYATVEEMLALAAQRGEDPLLVVCDAIEDPHNLGAIMRTAECAGAHGVIIPKRRSVSVNDTVYKTSAGAVEYVMCARVTNLAREIEALKKRGIWTAACDMDGSSVYESDLSGPVAVVVGGEGSGISRLVKEKCDFTVSIPMKGNLNSLNASNAAAITMYEIVRQRLSK